VEGWHNLKRRDGSHALNRETDLSEVSVATEEFFADHLDDLGTSGAQARLYCLVC